MWKILNEDEWNDVLNRVTKPGTSNRVVQTPPFHRQEKKNQTSENVSVLLCRLMLCDVRFFKHGIVVFSSVTANTVLVNTVSLHQVLYDMIAVVIVWNASNTTC